MTERIVVWGDPENEDETPDNREEPLPPDKGWMGDNFDENGNWKGPGQDPEWD